MDFERIGMSFSLISLASLACSRNGLEVERKPDIHHQAMVYFALLDGIANTIDSLRRLIDCSERMVLISEFGL